MKTVERGNGKREGGREAPSGHGWRAHQASKEEHFSPRKRPTEAAPSFRPASCPPQIIQLPLMRGSAVHRLCKTLSLAVLITLVGALGISCSSS